MFKFISFVLVIGLMMVFGSGKSLAAEANDAKMHYFRGIEYYNATLEFGKAIRLKPMKQHLSFQAPMFPQIYLKRVNDAETKEQKSEKPPLSTGKIAGEILAGGVGGFAGVIFIVAIPGTLIPDITENRFFHAIALISYPLGSAYGVYAVGNRDNETGSFLAAFLGSTVGFAVGMYGGMLVGIVIGGPEHQGAIPVIFGSLSALVGAPIGATIGFNLTRRYKSPPGTALINFRDGHISLAVPTIHSRPDSFGGRILTQRVDLVKVRF